VTRLARVRPAWALSAYDGLPAEGVVCAEAWAGFHNPASGHAGGEAALRAALRCAPCGPGYEARLSCTWAAALQRGFSTGRQPAAALLTAPHPACATLDAAPSQGRLTAQVRGYSM